LSLISMVDRVKIPLDLLSHKLSSNAGM